MAQAWIEQDDILPLLDGLDEVAQEHRPACIKAINAYREAQGTPLVVCSRTADYVTIGEKLLLSDALILRPLTQEQINEYLAAGGPALDGVRHAIQQDPVLQEMAQSPLLLSLMALTYRDHPPEQFTTTNPDDRRRQLFAAYIHRQLPQRRRDKREDPATTLRQLTYLAHQMTTRDQTIFLIERIQPTWLPTASQQRRYHSSISLAFVLGFALVIALLELLPLNRLYDMVDRVTTRLTTWLGGMLALGVAGGLVIEMIGDWREVLQHYTLRFWLHRYGYLPLNLVPFLDLAAERLILQKVGGGYRFVHRLLQDYLATLYVAEGEGVDK